ncbi:PREDICTED: HCLS1-binding protein 3 [Nanorana parkeri]|uniref:HCLS1-binding protein 3 n=1 Tax=Nanorana parkeri TaxID=125878 RepID=UPI000854CCBD|nr:PREDICTED: HCLS1-binding protein 3 [Nanorana parkeri]
MAAPVLTYRQVQNVHTGLDMWVPEYQEIRGRMMTGHVEYQIIVVTTLPAFKTAKHEPKDVVQFVVSKKYSEIEEFYQKICSRYPKNSLPPFPKKVLFVGETDIRERRAAFNDIVKAIAQERELSTSADLCDFLGRIVGNFVEAKGSRPYRNQPEDGDFFKDEEPPEDAILQIASKLRNKVTEPQKKEVEVEEEEEEEEEVDFDPLGIMKTKIKKKKVPPKKVEDPIVKPKTTTALFSDEVYPDAELFEPRKRIPATGKKSFMASDDVKLFEEQDLGGTVRKGDSLLLPSAYNEGPLFKPSRAENVDELFRVEEDFENLLNLGVKPKIKPKPKVPAKPSFLKETKKPDNNLAQVDSQPSAQAMDESDILRYIKENESADNDSLSLF